MRFCKAVRRLERCHTKDMVKMKYFTGASSPINSGSRREISASDARLIALSAQGFDRPRPTTVSETEIEDTARRLGLIQLDSVNVVVRSHYMPFFSRLGSYDRTLVEKVAFQDRRLFE